MKKTLFCALISLSSGIAFCQGPVLTPLGQRTQAPAIDLRTAAIITDTLELPFFDDFTVAAGYPLLNRWTDNQVWINNTFPVNQPNYNVATFDHLNQYGAPYTTLNKNTSVYADSLTSIPIKLDFFKTGPSTTQNYTITDSIFLSFFVEMNGLGDAPEAEDSLILFFLDNAGKWQRMWNKTGSAVNKFDLILVPVNEFEFLHNAFQFRFVNFTRSTGNLNHWHIDYVRLEKYKKRTGGFDVFNIKDVAITTPDYSFLKYYHSMPYSHYKADVSGQTNASNTLTLKNLDAGGTLPVQTRFAMQVRNQYNTLVYDFPFAANSQNVSKDQPAVINYPSIQMDTFSGANPCFTVKYLTIPQSNDGTPDAYNTSSDNNTITVNHCFNPWYAYDDGSAEGGFGLDYAFLGNIKGQFAMKFENVKKDSLRGLAIYFNRSESDVAFRSFYLRIWKSLSPIGQPDNKDELIYEKYVSKPSYTDSINHFSYIFFDTTLILDAGTFYCGWRQNQPYILNVGYDNNYRYLGQDAGNPNLFHNLLGQWERSDAGIKGTPMIRPLLGKNIDYTFSTEKISQNKTQIFPNPAQNIVNFKSNTAISKLQIFDFSGRLLFEKNQPGNDLDIAFLKAGTYVFSLTNVAGETTNTAIIKQQ
ncbi:MAG: T9SS type A sorting domain-containing protein [Bacteroidia bacterium]|nr:T9SS type A sorting domain-containing protein [Bacteroidia bacterium]